MSKAKGAGKSGQYYVLCPFCHSKRKPQHQKLREMWIDVNTGNYKCHNCDAGGRIDSEEYLAGQSRRQAASGSAAGVPAVTPPLRRVQLGWKTPRQWKSFHESSLDIPPQPVMDYLTGERALTADVVRQLRIGGDRQYFPQLGAEADCVVFNYYLDGQLVCQKMRSISGKHFLRSPECRSIPYNIDSLRVEKDEDGRRSGVYITEGETDAAALSAAGFSRVISVSSGANAGLDWITDFWDTHIDGVTDYCLAVDNDDAGRALEARLAERLGPVNCSVVRFGEGCKDADSHLVKYGIDSLREAVTRAKPYPLPNVVTQDDLDEEMDAYFRAGADRGMKTGWTGGQCLSDGSRFVSLDDIVTWQTKQLCLVTGRAGDGKSELVDELVLRLIKNNDRLKCLYFTPENSPVRRHVVKLCEKLTSKRFPQEDEEEADYTMKKWEFDRARDRLRSRVCHINSGGGEMKVDDIISTADNVVKRYGVNILVVDPFNYIEKEMEREWQVHQWESQVISKFHRFAAERGLLIFLVVHPRKVYESDRDGDRRRIEMYDISGTADFANKADYCIVVDRSHNNGMTTVFVDKVRNKDFGNRGKCHFLYNRLNGRFTPCQKLERRVDESIPGQDELKVQHDTSSWLDAAEEQLPFPSEQASEDGLPF